jgi:hypothetical protein
MVATTMPHVRGTKRRPVLEMIAAHFVAITTWIEGARRLPAIPQDLRLPHHLGIGVAVCGMMVAGSVTGYLLSVGMPAAVSAALVFTTPLYFILSLVATARARLEVSAVVLGCAVAPLFYLLLPGLDLLATGLVGGTAAFLWGNVRR